MLVENTRAAAAARGRVISAWMGVGNYYNDARSVATIVPCELERRIEEEDEEQMVKQELLELELLLEERRTRRVELGRPRTPEPMGLGIIRTILQPTTPTPKSKPTMTTTTTSASVHDQALQPRGSRTSHRSSISCSRD